MFSLLFLYSPGFERADFWKVIAGRFHFRSASTPCCGGMAKARIHAGSGLSPISDKTHVKRWFPVGGRVSRGSVMLLVKRFTGLSVEFIGM